MAIGIHGLLLGIKFDNLRVRPVAKPRQQSIAITLAVRRPQVPIKVENEPVVIPEKQPPEVSPPAKKKIPPRSQKLKPQDRQRPLVVPIKKPISNVVSKLPPEPSDTVEPVKTEPLLQPPTTDSIDEPAKQMIVEAYPLYRSNPSPQYPAMARRRGYTGQVVLNVFVSRNGSVLDLNLFSSSGHDLLDKAAVASVKNWTFEPGTRGNEKVDMWVRVPIRFELK